MGLAKSNMVFGRFGSTIVHDPGPDDASVEELLALSACSRISRLDFRTFRRAGSKPNPHSDGWRLLRNASAVLGFALADLRAVERVATLVADSGLRSL
jgi:hypothetical protein